MSEAKGIVADLAPPHAQSAWGSRLERVRVAGLAVCCNYLSKKKKSFNVKRYLNVFNLMIFPTKTLGYLNSNNLIFKAVKVN